MAPPIRDGLRPPTAGRVLVIGYGNPLRSDDGVGPRVAALVPDDPRFGDVAVLARQQLTPELALDMAESTLVVLVDADLRGEPGEVSLRRIDAASDRPSQSPPMAGATSHHVDPDQLLALAAEIGGASPEAAVVSVGIASVALGEGLSASVEAALPQVLDLLARIVTTELEADRAAR